MSWPVHLLGTLIESDGGVLQTGPFGSQLKQAEYASDGVPVIMPKDIENGEVNEMTVARVPETTVERLSRHKIRAGSKAWRNYQTRIYSSRSRRVVVWNGLYQD